MGPELATEEGDFQLTVKKDKPSDNLGIDLVPFEKGLKVNYVGDCGLIAKWNSSHTNLPEQVKKGDTIVAVNKFKATTAVVYYEMKNNDSVVLWVNRAEVVRELESKEPEAETQVEEPVMHPEFDVVQKCEETHEANVQKDERIEVEAPIVEEKSDHGVEVEVETLEHPEEQQPSVFCTICSTR
eukprot:TRINITY_DN52642_c0_g1_i1.p1 TRINITY_DN52642_c0_g1~~TRINITY_DN52642_c0_g1_i1.p1  ORF type:complete len:214 (+),score=28.75 TRINITY_DN52642_c0_g1_i1:92-643(+)